MNGSFAREEFGLSLALPSIEAMTARDFFAFTDTRPDEEKWELLDGIPVMNPSPSFLHQIVLKNLIGLFLNLERQGERSWAAVPGFGLRVTDTNVPVPDLLVRPDTLLKAQDCDDALVAIEILSPSTAHKDRRLKRTLYAHLPSLQHYIIVAQDDAVVLSYERRDGWAERKIGGLDARIEVPVLGITLPLADIYKGTGL